VIYSKSVFYYGFEITAENQCVDFIEDSGTEITAEIDVGSYTPTRFCAALKNALQTAGTLAYEITFDRTTRVISIESIGGSVKFLALTGSHNGVDPFAMMGFSKIADTALATTHAGSVAAGKKYEPQAWLQDYVPPEHLRGAVDATVSKTASGAVEVVSFGTESFMECSIILASNLNNELFGGYRPSPTGQDDLIAFLEFLRTKAPVEFMESKDDPANFTTLILESTTESNTGVKFRLKESWDKGLPNYYETGKLVFRVVGE
jgi:hypothetical protein